MTTKINHWLTYKKRWEFNGTAEEAVIFSGANGGYEARMQYEFLTQQGLQPKHHFLDLGCGALRGTIRLVGYLDAGHFHGLDISVGLLKEALIECERQKFDKWPDLRLMESFDDPKLMGPFDCILCNSVTVHIEPDDIGDLFKGIKDALAPTGRTFISIHPYDEKETEPHHWDGYRWWYKRSWLAKEAAGAGLHLTDMPGLKTNRIPAQRRPVIPIVNTNMTEWMMEGSL